MAARREPAARRGGFRSDQSTLAKRASIAASTGRDVGMDG
jgi:hypothetical protein